MRHTLGAVACLVLASSIGIASSPVQPNEPEVRKALPISQTRRIRQFADEFNAALGNLNYARVVDLTYPTLVKITGGRNKMIDLFRRGAENGKANGNGIVAIEVSEPKEVVTADKKQFAIVPVTMRVDVPEVSVRTKSFYIAVSSDRGRTWTFIPCLFIDGGKFTRRDLTNIVPGFPAQLSLPVIEERVFQPR